MHTPRYFQNFCQQMKKNFGVIFERIIHHTIDHTLILYIDYLWNAVSFARFVITLRGSRITLCGFVITFCCFGITLRGSRITLCGFGTKLRFVILGLNYVM